ncbi:MAG: hypothetical protein KGL97_08530 [Alphaproteobacteria bacterium]|nr:hypothetical protein [Alphaproteobacteria bacterium]
MRKIVSAVLFAFCLVTASGAAMPKYLLSPAFDKTVQLWLGTCAVLADPGATNEETAVIQCSNDVVSLDVLAEVFDKGQKYCSPTELSNDESQNFVEARAVYRWLHAHSETWNAQLHVGVEKALPALYPCR